MADKTALELITAAMRVLGKLESGGTPTSNEQSDGLENLIIMLREWSADGFMVFVYAEDSHTLTSGTASYTIGSGATISTTRPVKIQGAYLRDGGGLDHPITIIGAEKYRSIAQKSTGSDTPKWLHYLPGYSQGTIYLFPPGGGTLYLHSLKQLSEPAAVGNDVVFPGEYDAAIKWNLACEMASEFGREPTPFMMQRAAQTKRNVININAALSLDTVDPEILQVTRRWHINEG